MDMLPSEMVFTPSEFVAEYNAALETVFPVVVIEGELLNFKVAQNKWVYADIADDESKIRLFGSVYKLQHQVSDGMRVKVLAQPRLHPQYGLSLNFEIITPLGEGSIKKAAEELALKLSKEGLFDESRKRTLPKYPTRVGLVTSLQSAAYADFTKIMNARWSGVEVIAHQSTVQGDSAPGELCRAIETLNTHTPELDVIVLVRGGGSPEDLQAFSAESVVRAVAQSRVPTLVGVGHEIDISLSEMAADVAASTPSNAAELLFPDARDELRSLSAKSEMLQRSIISALEHCTRYVDEQKTELRELVNDALERRETFVESKRQFMRTTNPKVILSRGYGMLTDIQGAVVTSVKGIDMKNDYTLALQDGEVVVKRVK